MDLVPIERLKTYFAEKPSPVVFHGRQGKDPLDAQVARHFDAYIERIRVMVGISMVSETHVEVALDSALVSLTPSGRDRYIKIFTP